ncbi:chaperone NapD [Arabiibacter massiliensis]|uniref:chaperone NapD n=1 Tax=Arabiibacter massiliensis TaxID=1870985 RepID=UPI0009BBD395|nr:chaperone NapD [Arabiibacter massiliensis]
MVISSLVVETAPEHTDDVARELSGREGVEVHEKNDYKLVVTIEAETVDDSHGIASSFIGIEGVTGINLVYANFEDDPTLAKAGQR